MRKENFKRSFWNMTKFWGISNKTWLDTIRPMLIWTIMYLIISYFSGSFDAKNIYFTALAVIIISIVVFCFCFIFITPSQIYNDQEAKFTNLTNDQQKKINDQQNAIDNLTKKLDIRERRKKLAQDLIEIKKKHSPLLNNHAGPLLDKSSPLFVEVMDLLKNSNVFSEADIYFFENGKLPTIGTFHHPNNARGIILETLIENALFLLKEE